MKGVYIYHSDSKEELSKDSVGVLKKIFSQYEVLRKNVCENFDIFCVNTKKSRNKIHSFFSHLFLKQCFDLSQIKDIAFDFVYIRRFFIINKSTLFMLKMIKKINPSCKILLEIPTYPYDKEYTGFVNKVALLIDKIYRKKIYRYIDRIVTLTNDKEIFGCKTLKFTNGVDCSSIPVCKKVNFDKNHINLIAVAQFSFWHGYERVIEGLSKYKKNDVFLHLVGNGDELEKYKSLVKKYGLENQVIFYGPLSGDELSAVFDIADVAICSLACHKKNISLSAELKSREYLCRGLPMVTSTKIDIISDDFKYFFKVPEDDSPINIEEIVTYVNDLYKDGRREIVEKTRKFAEDNCSMEKTMENIIKFYIAENKQLLK